MDYIRASLQDIYLNLGHEWMTRGLQKKCLNTGHQWMTTKATRLISETWTLVDAQRLIRKMIPQPLTPVNPHRQVPELEWMLTEQQDKYLNTGLE